MAIKKILLFDSPTLRKPSELITSDKINSPEIKELMLDLLDTMYSMPAYGVAAIQIGVPMQMFVLDTAWNHETGDNQKPMIFMNPVIMAQTEPTIFEEGCLSIPGGTTNNKRYNRILLEYTNMDGARVMEEFTDITAIAIQHEVEHLQGKLFIDDFGPIKKSIVFKRMKKYLKNQKRSR
jgi:peptide deformylase